MAMTLRSGAFPAGGSIPDEYTCTGMNVSPPLAWDGVPERTGSLALVIEDPDAPSGTYDHWVIYNIPSGSTGFSEKIPHDERLPDGSIQGKNSAGKIGYTGPCPPSGEHRYFFRLYALDIELRLEPGAGKKKLLDAAAGHVLAEADLMGRYAR